MSGAGASYRNSVASQQQYNSFSERANRQFAGRNSERSRPVHGAGGARLVDCVSVQPAVPPLSSRLSSVESIATTVDEKKNSPLNKSNEAFTDADGGTVTANFVAKLRGLDSKNSQNELSIKKFLTKSEEAFFDKVKEDKSENSANLSFSVIRSTIRTRRGRVSIRRHPIVGALGGGGESRSATIIILPRP